MSRILGSATQELRQAVFALDRSEVPSLVLCPLLRSKQQYLHATYGDRVFVHEKTERQIISGDLPEPLLQGTEGEFTANSVVKRLVATRLLCTEVQAGIEIEQSKKLGQLIFKAFGEDIPETLKLQALERHWASEIYNGAFTGLKAIQNMLARKANHHDVEKCLLDPALSVCRTGRMAFTPFDAKWIGMGGKGSIYSMSDLTLSNSYFGLEEVSTNTLLKVGGIPIQQTQWGRPDRQTVSKLGLWQISGTMVEWAQRKYDQIHEASLIKGRRLNFTKIPEIFTEDLEWVNDDSGIILNALNKMRTGKYLTDSTIILVTGDIKLSRKLANTIYTSIYRIDARDLLHMYPDREVWNEDELPGHVDLWSKLVSLDPSISTWKTPVDVLYDTGHISAVLVDIFNVSHAPTREVWKKTINRSGFDEIGRRLILYSLRVIHPECRVRCVRPEWGRFKRNVMGEKILHTS